MVLAVSEGGTDAKKTIPDVLLHQCTDVSAAGSLHSCNPALDRTNGESKQSERMREHVPLNIFSPTI